jgi:homoserine O-acetyltransferase
MSGTLTTGSPTHELALGELITDAGRAVSGLRLRYRVIGDVDAATDNGWILVFHALTGSADVDAWWGPLVGPGKALDTNRHAVAARALAMITYRSGTEFQARFGRQSSRSEGVFDVEHYLRRQGQKLVARFDAASYVALTRTMDLHDIGDLTAAAQETALRVSQVIGVGIDSDILYLPGEVRDWVSAYQTGGARAEYREIASLYGHDAFLIEWDQVERILRGV